MLKFFSKWRKRKEGLGEGEEDCQDVTRPIAEEGKKHQYPESLEELWTMRDGPIERKISVVTIGAGMRGQVSVDVCKLRC